MGYGRSSGFALTVRTMVVATRSLHALACTGGSHHLIFLNFSLHVSGPVPGWGQANCVAQRGTEATEAWISQVCVSLRSRKKAMRKKSPPSQSLCWRPPVINQQGLSNQHQNRFFPEFLYQNDAGRAQRAGRSVRKAQGY